jgi:hypothetical protein
MLIIQRQQVRTLPHAGPVGRRERELARAYSGSGGGLFRFCHIVQGGPVASRWQGERIFVIHLAFPTKGTAHSKMLLSTGTLPYV